MLPAVDALSLEPGIRPEDLRGAGYYFDDLLLFPERLCLENVLSACRHGARAFNYAQVEEIAARHRRRAVTGVRVRDLLDRRASPRWAPGSSSTRPGPWVDELRALAGVQRPRRRTSCAAPRASTACCRA